MRARVHIASTAVVFVLALSIQSPVAMGGSVDGTASASPDGAAVKTATLASTFAPAARAWSSSRQVAVDCDTGDPTPQRCDPAFVHKVRVPLGKTIVVKRIRYRAAAQHCSSARVQVFRNGKKVGTTAWVGPGEVTVIKGLHITLRRLAGGKPHRFLYRALGRVEGCNTGYVASWGGQLTLIGVIKGS